jgi:hypothetical protein
LLPLPLTCCCSDPDVKKVCFPIFFFIIHGTHRRIQDISHWPFEVVEKDGSPLIKVQYLGDEKTFSPQEISSMVLSKMKDISEAKLGKTVKKAVVTSVSTFIFGRFGAYRSAVYLLTSMILSAWLQRMLALLRD